MSSYHVESGFELLTIVNDSVLSCYYQNNSLFLLTATSLLLLVINQTSTTLYTLGHGSSLTTVPPLQASTYTNQVILASSSNRCCRPCTRCRRVRARSSRSSRDTCCSRRPP